MTDSDFLEAVFSSPASAVLLFVGTPALLWWFTRQLRVHALHPFAYVFNFNLGTGYATALFFVLHFPANPTLVGYTLACALVVVLFLRLGFSRCTEERIWPIVDVLAEANPRTVFQAGLWLSLGLFAAFAATGVNTILSESRFASAAGVGGLIRLIEAFTTVVLCFAPLAGEAGGRKTLAFGALLYVASQVLVAGSKGGVLEAVLWYVFLSRSSGRRVPYLKIGIAMVAAFAAFGIVLFFNLKGRGMEAALAMQGRFTELPMLVEMGIARIIANGDMYYFLLPPGVEEYVSGRMALAPLQPLLQVPGGAAASLVGVDIHNNEPGRLGYLYWYPDAPMGGPTNHLDMATYFYWGPFVGVLAAGAIAYLIGWVHGAITKPATYSAKTAVLAVFYSKLLAAFLSPSIALQRLVDAALALGLVVGFLRIRDHLRLHRKVQH